MDWQIKQKTKNISSCLSENESLYFFHYIYFAVCLIGEAIQKARMPCEVCPRCNGFLAHMRPGKKGHQKKCGRCPSPLRLRFDTAVYYCVNHSACMYLLVLTESVCSEWATVVCTRCCYRVGWWLDATGECHLVDCAQIKAVVLKSQVDFVSSTSSFHTEYLLVNCSIHEQILYFSLRRGLKYDLSWTAHLNTIHTK